METMILKPLDLKDSLPSITYEWRHSLIRSGAPLLLSKADSQYQYRSLYGFPPETTNFINQNKNTKNLKDFPVFSDTLIIDCDTDLQKNKTRYQLIKLGISFEIWTTGNRGYHFHIPIVPMLGEHVVRSQVAWLKKNNLWESIDNSIYRAGSIIRVAGAIHEKTNKPKRKLKTIYGKLPEIKFVKKPAALKLTEDSVLNDPTRYYENLLIKKRTGGRHVHIFILWSEGKKAGIDWDIISNDILWWNSNMAVPSHNEQCVKEKLRKFYEQEKMSKVIR